MLEFKKKTHKCAVIVLAHGFYSNCYRLYWQEYGGNCVSLDTVAYAVGVWKLLLLN
jgi:O-methyltransferase involved in polyketide biosynthesis